MSVFFSYVSKVFERIAYNQLVNFMINKLSDLLTGFRKNHSTQHCLICMFEIQKGILDKGGYMYTIFMDLSKAF